MAKEDPFGDEKLIRLQLCLYLLPVLGTIPALWQLRQPNRSAGDHQRQKLAKQSLRFTLVWLTVYCLLWTTGHSLSDVSALRLMYLNGLATTGYFLGSLGWMAWLFFRPTKELAKPVAKTPHRD